MYILLLIALTLWSPAPQQDSPGPSGRTGTRAHYLRHLRRLQARHDRRTKRPLRHRNTPNNSMIHL